MSRPQVIDDEEHERVHDRVAAVDVAKDAGVVCTRLSRLDLRTLRVWPGVRRAGRQGRAAANAGQRRREAPP